MKKRIIPILVAVLMVFTIMPMTAGKAYGGTVEVEIDGLNYRIDMEQGTAWLYGGASFRKKPLIIPETVTYYDETHPKRTYSVTRIEDNAFRHTNMPSVTLPASLISIGGYAFADCDSLTTVSFKENSNLKTIGEYAFFNCKSLTTVSFKENSNLKTIGEYAFCLCSNLTSIDIPPSVNEIGFGCFARTGIESIVLPEGLKEINSNLFGSKLKEVTIPSTVTTIWDWAFHRCDALTTIYFNGTKAQWDAIYKGMGMPDIEPICKDYPPDTASIDGAKVALSAKAFTFNGKVQKPVIKTIGGQSLHEGKDYTVKWSNKFSKNVGKYTLTIKGMGAYTGTTKAAYKINPKGMSIKSLTGAKKAITVKWNKQSAKMSKSRITGYQIRLATNKKFTKNKKTVTVKGYKNVSKKIKNLKSKKRYYVKIRTYKSVGGDKCYSPWSKAKSVKTR